MNENEVRLKLQKALHEIIDPSLSVLLADGDYDFQPEPGIDVTQKAASLDQELSNLNRRVGGSLTKSDIAEMVGLSLEEVEAIHQKQKPVKKLKEFLDLGNRNGLPMDLQKSFRYMEKSYTRTGSLTESMTEAMELFQEFFSGEEVSLLQKAIKALDLSVFLTILSGGMKKAAAAA